MASDNVQLTSRCLCKAQVFTASVSKENLPLTRFACHCTSCRHLTGTMFTFCGRWHGDASKVLNSNLQSYHMTEHTELLSCKTCSSPLFFHYKNSDVEFIVVLIASLDNIPGVEVARIADHIYVGDTADGGASSYMLRPNGVGDDTPLPRWGGWRQDDAGLDVSWPTGEAVARNSSSQKELIPFYCHCKGVNFVLRRPTTAFKDTPEDKLPIFVAPKTRKLRVSFDACDSCRLVSGAHVMTWTFAFLEHIEIPGTGKAVAANTADLKAQTELVMNGEANEALGTLAFYASSPDVQRYHCSRCSATVFYAVDDRPDMVDISVGLFDAEEGARAESFLSWTGSMGQLADVEGGWREKMYKAVRDEHQMR